MTRRARAALWRRVSEAFDSETGLLFGGYGEMSSWDGFWELATERDRGFRWSESRHATSLRATIAALIAAMVETGDA